MRPKRHTVANIIAAECAGYVCVGPYQVRDWCWRHDKVCKLIVAWNRCGYFEGAVLPAWPDVAAEYADKAHTGDARPTVRINPPVCPICTAEFVSRQNRQRYCSAACRAVGDRHAAATRQRQQRRKVRVAKVRPTVTVSESAIPLF